MLSQKPLPASLLHTRLTQPTAIAWGRLFGGDQALLYAGYHVPSFRIYVLLDNCLFEWSNLLQKALEHKTCWK